MRGNTNKWIRIFVMLGALFLLRNVYAEDTTNIEGLNTMLTSGQQLLRILAKWGGVGLIVTGAILIGFHKTKGETMGVIVWILLACGLLIAAFGWWEGVFTNGFAF
jgi:hypothetical protein